MSEDWTDEHIVALDLLCCVMVADRMASGVEKQLIRDLLKQDDCPWTDAEIAGRIREFAERVKKGGLESTINNVCDSTRGLKLDRVREIFDDCVQIAKADGEFTKRETRVLDRIQELIPELKLTLIAEHHPEAARPRASSAGREARTVEDEEVSAAGKVVSLIVGVLFVMGLLVLFIQRKDFEAKFASIKTGITDAEEVIELLGTPVERRSQQLQATGPGGFRDADQGQTSTTMIWGKRFPIYTDEYCYTVHLLDGIVTSTNVQRGEKRPDY